MLLHARTFELSWHAVGAQLERGVRRLRGKAERAFTHSRSFEFVMTTQRLARALQLALAVSEGRWH